MKPEPAWLTVYTRWLRDIHPLPSYILSTLTLLLMLVLGVLYGVLCIVFYTPYCLLFRRGHHGGSV